MSERVIVAMSGGVDSSVAAALLKEQGFEVVGITICFNLDDPIGNKPGCCGRQGIEDARRVADSLGIKHYVVNMQKFLEKEVIRNFCLEYARGRTPNPCVRCNQYIKFEALLKKALALNARYLATGHYARITRNKNHYRLEKAKDLKKDQSYFLYRLKQRQMKHILFPLGNYTKDRVRNLAREFSLPVAEKPDSQEICFIPKLDYRQFLKDRLPGMKNLLLKDIHPGPIIDKDGEILGRHQGVAFYTIGQREGLGIALGYPAYVTGIDFKKNVITIGKREEACAREFWVKELSFMEPVKNTVALKVRIRYNHKESPARITPLGNKVRVRFAQSQFAVTPGQSAVFYLKLKVVGGGIIHQVIN
jgi:tRNA-specific 2-thiouridylase